MPCCALDVLYVPHTENNRSLEKRMCAIIVELIVHGYDNPGIVSVFSQWS